MSKQDKPKTRISILIPCEIDDTAQLMGALNHVAQKLRVSTTIRGYAGDGFAWTVSDANQANTRTTDGAKTNARQEALTALDNLGQIYSDAGDPREFNVLKAWHLVNNAEAKASGGGKE